MDTNRHRPPEAIYATVAGRQREALKNLVAGRKANKAIAAICEDYVSQKKSGCDVKVGWKEFEYDDVMWCDMMWYKDTTGMQPTIFYYLLIDESWRKEGFLSAKWWKPRNSFSDSDPSLVFFI